MSLVVFHLLPIPGLDGARIVALLLPPQAREVYRNADKYLPLFVLVVLFVFSTLILGFLTALSGALCNAATGSTAALLPVASCRGRSGRREPALSSRASTPRPTRAAVTSTAVAAAC